MTTSNELLRFNEWLRREGYEKIRGCYRKADGIIKWSNEVESEYAEYVKHHRQLTK